MTEAKKPPELPTSTARQLAGLFDVAAPYITELVAKEIIPRPISKGRFNTTASVTAYIQHLRNERKGATKVAALNAYQAAKAREVEQRIAERDRSLIPFEEAVGLVDLVVGEMAQELDALPASFTRDRGQRRLLETKVDGIRERISTSLEKRAAALAAGGEIIEAEISDFAG